MESSINMKIYIKLSGMCYRSILCVCHILHVYKIISYVLLYLLG